MQYVAVYFYFLYITCYYGWCSRSYSSIIKNQSKTVEMNPKKQRKRCPWNVINSKKWRFVVKYIIKKRMDVWKPPQFAYRLTTIGDILWMYIVLLHIKSINQFVPFFIQPNCTRVVVWKLHANFISTILWNRWITPFFCLMIK